MLKPLFAASLLLLITTSVPACEPEGEGAVGTDEPPQFREGVNAEFESLEVAGKLLGSCVTVERPVTVTLVRDHIWADGMQSFNVLLESTAPVGEVDCILGVLEDNQP